MFELIMLLVFGTIAFAASSCWVVENEKLDNWTDLELEGGAKSAAYVIWLYFFIKYIIKGFEDLRKAQ